MRSSPASAAGARRSAPGLHEVPVVVHDVSDKEALELAIIENVQRSDLNPLEEAAGYQQLIDAFGYSQAEIAEGIGKSRPHVANTLRLLKLPESVRVYVADGRLSAGHARALIGAKDPEAMAKQIVAAGLTVRDVEALGENKAAPRKARKSAPRRTRTRWRWKRRCPTRSGSR